MNYSFLLSFVGSSLNRIQTGVVEFQTLVYLLNIGLDIEDFYWKGSPLSCLVSSRIHTVSSLKHETVLINKVRPLLKD